MQRAFAILWVVLAICLTASSAEAVVSEIRILHINDLHGFAQPHQPLGAARSVGGIGHLATRVKELRREKPTLFLAAGDLIQGNNWANLFRGQSVIEALNVMGLDAMVVGNHEFDFGQEVLKERIGEARFPVLGANVEGLPELSGPMVRELGGLRVGIIGVVTPDTPESTHPKNVTGLRFRSPRETVEEWAREAGPGLDLLIVLSHCGYAMDRELAASVPGIHVIVGGHSHTRIERPVLLNGTLIVQAWEHGKGLGVLDLTFENGQRTGWRGHMEEIGPFSGAPDPVVQEIADRYEGRLNSRLKERVGETLVDLDGENVRRRETNLGNLVADIMRRASGADAAIINGGSIRTSLRRGDILVGHVYTALPFDNYIVAIQLTGRQIREALEHGVAGVEHGEGRFPQVSGLTFSYRPSAPAGFRVEEIRVNGAPLLSGRGYSVATNDFLAAGGDGYRAFGEAMARSKGFAVVGGMMTGEKLLYSDAGRWLRDVVIEFVRETKTVSPRVEGRIVEVP